MTQDARPFEASDVQRYRERLRLLREIDRAILKTQSVDQTAAVAVQGFRQLVPCLRASVALFDFAADEVVLLATCSDSALQLRAGAQAQLSRAFFLGDSPHGQPHLVADLSAAPFTHPWVELLRSEGVRGHASFPLTTEGQVIGALTFGLECPGPPPPDALQIAADIADQLAVAIMDARLRAEVRRHAEELEARVAARTAALHQSEARFRAIFEAAPIGMALTTPDGRILQSNPASQRLLGRTEAELRGMLLTDLSQRDGSQSKTRGYRHGVIRHVAEVVTAQGSPLKSEHALSRKDGRTIWVHLTLAHVSATSEAGNLVVTMIEDVTEVRRTQAALVQAERLAITGRLGASLAHEINNPLQSIIGCLGLADETLSEPAEAGRFLAVAREELRRVARTVAQLRDLQGVSEQERVEPVDLNDMLAQLLTLNTQKCTQQGISIAWQPASRLPRLAVAPDRIRQVFLNVILNAMDAMPQGGRLVIRTASTRKPAGARVTVRDTGAGMSPGVLARIFEPFYSTKKKGLGLGLFTSRSIVEQHRGTIEARSHPGQGTTFVVWLPVRPEELP
jgi:PAS domain S-box-containing protein